VPPSVVTPGMTVTQPQDGQEAAQDGQ